MRVLVTGSEGLIGLPLCGKLIQRGDSVVPYDITLDAACDIRDRDHLEAVCTQEKPDAVIHLAAMSHVERCRQARYDAWHVNFTGTLNVLEACLTKQRPVVIASSNHIYGHGDSPVDEDALQVQLDTYSATKHAADLAARSYAHNYGLPVAIVRNTNCFGPHDPHLDHIVPSTIISLLQDKTPVVRSDGKRIKAYLYADDVADAYIAVLDWLMQAKREQYGEAFNVSGQRLSVLDLVNMITALIRPMASVIIAGRPDDQSDEWLDDRKLRNATQWYAKHTLSRGLELTIDGLSRRMHEGTL